MKRIYEKPVLTKRGKLSILAAGNSSGPTGPSG
ncbi:putative RiPP precursor [Mesorhizobium sp. B2-7-1]|nr:putative RiPP precursor [Mesorhizobium sp. B2-7-1]